MDGTSVRYTSIGEIHTEFDSAEGMPIQPSVAGDTTGTVELDERYAPALQDLDGFSHCILLYHFHGNGDDAPLTVTPFLDEDDHGLFATRAPKRPNSIGLSVVGIESIEGATMTVSGIDVLDGTPLLDIKPFVAEFDVPEDTESGWIAAADEDAGREFADDRFLAESE